MVFVCAVSLRRVFAVLGRLVVPWLGVVFRVLVEVVVVVVIVVV